MIWFVLGIWGHSWVWWWWKNRDICWYVGAKCYETNSISWTWNLVSGSTGIRKAGLYILSWKYIFPSFEKYFFPQRSWYVSFTELGKKIKCVLKVSKRILAKKGINAEFFLIGNFTGFFQNIANFVNIELFAYKKFWRYF